MYLPHEAAASEKVVAKCPLKIKLCAGSVEQQAELRINKPSGAFLQERAGLPKRLFTSHPRVLSFAQRLQNPKCSIQCSFIRAKREQIVSKR